MNISRYESKSVWGGSNIIFRPSMPLIGLVDMLFPPETMREEVKAYAEALAQKPADALAAIRRTITEGGAISFEEGLKIEYESAIKLAGTEDFSEGISAFLEKRKPEWE
jgi:enoyl-CoA hydratase